jgi:hypothetical protein
LIQDRVAKIELAIKLRFLIEHVRAIGVMLIDHEIAVIGTERLPVSSGHIDGGGNRRDWARWPC